MENLYIDSDNSVANRTVGSTREDLSGSLDVRDLQSCECTLTFFLGDQKATKI